jgi:AraC-like DNA-binding protein
VLVDEPVLLLPILLSGKTRYRHRDGTSCEASAGKWTLSLMATSGTEYDHRVGEPCSAISMLFTASRLRTMLDGECLPRLVQNFLDARFDPVCIEIKMSGIMRRLAAQVKSNPYKGATASLYLQGKVFEILAEAFTELDAPVSDSGKSERERRRALVARDLLMENLANPPSIEDVARQVGLSQRRLGEVFIDIFGAGPFQCLTQWRLDEARSLLHSGENSVKKVAYMMGYAHVSSFSYAFSRQFGVPPTGRVDVNEISDSQLHVA